LADDDYDDGYDDGTDHDHDHDHDPGDAGRNSEASSGRERGASHEDAPLKGDRLPESSVGECYC
jgi:hypothetical protein